MGLPQVLERIAQACRRAGRRPEEVRLVAVTKGRSVEEIREKVLAYGTFPLGESRVQEALKKMDLLQAEWHLVGHLQRNKAKFAPASPSSTPWTPCAWRRPWRRWERRPGYGLRSWWR